MPWTMPSKLAATGAFRQDLHGEYLRLRCDADRADGVVGGSDDAGHMRAMVEGTDGGQADALSPGTNEVESGSTCGPRSTSAAGDARVEHGDAHAIPAVSGIPGARGHIDAAGTHCRSKRVRRHRRKPAGLRYSSAALCVSGVSNWKVTSGTTERTPCTLEARVRNAPSDDSTIATPIGRRAGDACRGGFDLACELRVERLRLGLDSRNVPPGQWERTQRLTRGPWQSPGIESSLGTPVIFWEITRGPIRASASLRRFTRLPPAAMQQSRSFVVILRAKKRSAFFGRPLDARYDFDQLLTAFAALTRPAP